MVDAVVDELIVTASRDYGFFDFYLDPFYIFLAPRPWFAGSIDIPPEYTSPPPTPVPNPGNFQHPVTGKINIPDVIQAIADDAPSYLQPGMFDISGYDLEESGSYLDSVFNGAVGNANLGLVSAFGPAGNAVENGLQMQIGDFRLLTEGEKNAALLYTDLTSTQLSEVTVRASRILANADFILTLGNVIYVPQSFARTDFSANSIDFSTIVHELRHVKQWADNIPLSKVLNDQIESALMGGAGGGAYNYSMSDLSARSYSQQTMEKQATMVEDLYRAEYGDSYRWFMGTSSQLSTNALRAYVFANDPGNVPQH